MRHNAGVDPSKRVRSGDLLVSVNGLSGNTQEMSAELRARAEVACEFARFEHFNVQITKSGPLGIDVVHTHRDLGVSLALMGIAEGPITRWNDEHPEAQVQRLDRIVAVNSRRGNPEEGATLRTRDRSLGCAHGVCFGHCSMPLC